MTPCVRHWKVYYGGFWHHFLDFRRLPIARLHWGYDCIVELVAHSKPAVRRTSWEEILQEAAGNKPVLVRERRGGLEAIYYRTSTKLQWQFYNFFLYNCEHFANECMIGRRRSPQVRARTSQAVTALGAGTVGLTMFEYPHESLSLFSLATASATLSVLCAYLFARFVIQTFLSLRRMRRLRERRERMNEPTTALLV